MDTKNEFAGGAIPPEGSPTPSPDPDRPSLTPPDARAGRPVALVDLDGVLGDPSNRMHLAEECRWDEFHGRCHEDPPHYAENELIRGWADRGGEVIYCTARTENFRPETERWLSQHQLPPGKIFMRAVGDYRPSRQIKREVLHQLQNEGHKIAFAMDDNDSVVYMYRFEGITCIQPRSEHQHGVPALMHNAIETYCDRSEVYDDSEQKFGSVMSKLFPGGMTLKTHKDWVRWGLLTQIVSKLCRYSATPGHLDSIHDLGVYAFMLEAEDRK